MGYPSGKDLLQRKQSFRFARFFYCMRIFVFATAFLRYPCKECSIPSHVLKEGSFACSLGSFTPLGI